jgi:hypothetical protein
MAAVLRGVHLSNRSFASLIAELAGVPANVLEYQDHGLGSV